jgi:hypothetical protein
MIQDALMLAASTWWEDNFQLLCLPRKIAHGGSRAQILLHEDEEILFLQMPGLIGSGEASVLSQGYSGTSAPSWDRHLQGDGN